MQFAKAGNANGAGLPICPPDRAESDAHWELGDTIGVHLHLRREACDLNERLLRERLGLKK